MRTYCIAQGTLLSALWWLKWEGNKKKRIYVYTLEKEMATHSSNLAWRIPRTEEPGGLQFMVSQRVDMTKWLTHTHTHVCIHTVDSLCCTSENSTMLSCVM